MISEKTEELLEFLKDTGHDWNISASTQVSATARCTDCGIKIFLWGTAKFIFFKAHLLDEIYNININSKIDSKEEIPSCNEIIMDMILS